MYIYIFIYVSNIDRGSIHGGNGESFLTGVVCCSVLQCVAVCCSVLQRVAACCSVLQFLADTYML